MYSSTSGPSEQRSGLSKRRHLKFSRGVPQPQGTGLTKRLRDAASDQHVTDHVYIVLKEIGS